MNRQSLLNSEIVISINAASFNRGYIQTELMTCCLGRKHKNFVFFCKIFNSYILCFSGIDTINYSGRYFTCEVCHLVNIGTKL